MTTHNISERATQNFLDPAHKWCAVTCDKQETPTRRPLFFAIYTDQQVYHSTVHIAATSSMNKKLSNRWRERLSAAHWTGVQENWLSTVGQMHRFEIFAFTKYRSSFEPNKSGIVKRLHHWCAKLKYVHKFSTGGHITWHRACAMMIPHVFVSARGLGSNISKTDRNRTSVPMDKGGLENWLSAVGQCTVLKYMPLQSTMALKPGLGVY